MQAYAYKLAATVAERIRDTLEVKWDQPPRGTLQLYVVLAGGGCRLPLVSRGRAVASTSARHPRAWPDYPCLVRFYDVRGQNSG